MKLSTNQYLLIGLGAAAFLGGGILLLKKPNVEENKTDSTPSPSVATPKFSNGTKLTTKNESANIRSSASTSASIVKTVSKGDLIGSVVSSTKDSSGYFWYKVDGGYVREDIVGVYVYKEPAYIIGTRLQPLGTSAIVKTTPFDSSNTLNPAIKGFFGTVVSDGVVNSDGKSWYKVLLNAPILSTSGNIYTNGYVKSEQVKMYNK